MIPNFDERRRQKIFLVSVGWMVKSTEELAGMAMIHEMKRHENISISVQVDYQIRQKQ